MTTVLLVPALALARSAGTTRSSLPARALARIFHRLESRELDIVELAVLLLDTADVDVLHDVAGLRIDRDRAARALPRHALHRGDERVAFGRALGLCERRIDHVHAVIAADRDEVRPEAVG